MATITTTSPRIAIEPKFDNGDEFLHSIGDVPMSRVIFDPWPGTTTEKDLFNFTDHNDRLCELIDGTLVEKARGYYVSFIKNDRLQGHVLSEEPVPAIAPNLAVEIISEGNIVRGMRQKTVEYFHSGAQRVWLIYPKTRTVAVFEQQTDEPTRVLNQNDVLSGGVVLPGFTLEISKLFSKLPK